MASPWSGKGFLRRPVGEEISWWYFANGHVLSMCEGLKQAENLAFKKKKIFYIIMRHF